MSFVFNYVWSVREGEHNLPFHFIIYHFKSEQVKKQQRVLDIAAVSTEYIPEIFQNDIFMKINITYGLVKRFISR